MLVDLQRFEIKGSVLFIEGIGIIEGVNAKEWSDIGYSLLFLSSDNVYEKPLAKDHRPSVTAQYAKNGENYDKCWFTTKAHAGVDISDIPLGQYYELRLKIITPTVTEISPLASSIDGGFLGQNYELIFSESNKLLINSYEPLLVVTNFNSSKFAINGDYIDSHGNVIKAPFGLANCHVRFVGKNNRVVIHKQANLKNVYIELLMDDALVEIEENVRMMGNWRIGHGCTLKIGKNSSSTNPVYMTCAEGSSIIIGEDCMFATNNQIRTDDAHPIYDVNTGNRINFSKDVKLGNHVWVGYGATLLGGASVGDGSVIGAYALVNKSHSNNCLLVGMPAKTVKHDIFWERAPLLVTSKEPKHYTQEELSQKSYCNNTIVD